MDIELQEVTTAASGHVADSLLAFAKDNRYINKLSMLLVNIIKPHVQIASYIETQDDLEPGESLTAAYILRPEIDLLSRIIYAWIVINEGTTLGLEHVGLSYDQNEGSRKRLRLFAALYTVFPYLIQRVGGERGWNNLCRIRIRRGLRSNYRLDAVREARGREELRGRDRRRVYEEMRMRMVDRSNTNRNTNQHARRELQSQLSRNRSASSPGHSYQYLRRILQKGLSSMAIAAKSSIPVPHELSDATTNRSRSNVNNDDRMANLFKWFIRLNLALFYVKGEYFSILHRVTGTKIQIERKRNHAVSIISERPEYKMIGLMIILQAGAKGVQAGIDLLLNSWFSLSRSNRNESELKLEAKVPSNTASKKRGNQTEHVVTTAADQVQCGICMADRRHPAAPVNCGHIFCWNCIQHWIATVRHECPLCRSPARPQDVIALHNYSP